MLKETDKDIIFVETLKKETLLDLLHFDDVEDFISFGFSLKDTKKHIADSLTKIISNSIYNQLSKYIEEIVEKKIAENELNNKNKLDGEKNGDKKDKDNDKKTKK